MNCENYLLRVLHVMCLSCLCWEESSCIPNMPCSRPQFSTLVDPHLKWISQTQQGPLQLTRLPYPSKLCLGMFGSARRSSSTTGKISCSTNTWSRRRAFGILMSPSALDNDGTVLIAADFKYLHFLFHTGVLWTKKTSSKTPRCFDEYFDDSFVPNTKKMSCSIKPQVTKVLGSPGRNANSKSRTCEWCNSASTARLGTPQIFAVGSVGGGDTGWGPPVMWTLVYKPL